MAVRIHPHSPPTLSQASDQGYVGQVLTALINAVKKVWAQVLCLIEGIFHCATCGRFAPVMPPATDLAQPPQVTERSPTPVVGETDLVEMRTRDQLTGRSPTPLVGEEDLVVMGSRDQYPLGGLLTETIQLVFMDCLSQGEIKAFKALSRTNVHSYVTMRKLVNEVALTVLCPKLRILNAKTYTFQADLITIDKYNALQSYYKLATFVEDQAGLTIIFNHGGLTFKDMKENNCGVGIDTCLVWIAEELDNVPEEDTGPEMISNDLITETRDKSPEVQETRVRDEVGFDGKPTLIQYLALVIAAQKDLGICLRTSTQVRGHYAVVGYHAPGRFIVCDHGWGSNRSGAGGRRKL